MAFHERISNRFITELAEQSALDRRKDQRQTVSFRAEVQSELKTGFEPLQVVNYSSGGFCALTANDLGECGNRLMLRIQVDGSTEATLVRGKVTWKNDVGQGHAIGCSFLTMEDSSRIRNLLDPQSRERWRKSMRKYRPTRWGMVAAAVIIILGLQLTNLMSQSRQTQQASQQDNQVGFD